MTHQGLLHPSEELHRICHGTVRLASHDGFGASRIVSACLLLVRASRVCGVPLEHAAGLLFLRISKCSSRYGPRNLHLIVCRVLCGMEPVLLAWRCKTCISRVFLKQSNPISLTATEMEWPMAVTYCTRPLFLLLGFWPERQAGSLGSIGSRHWLGLSIGNIMRSLSRSVLLQVF